VPFWRDLGDALRAAWETLTGDFDAEIEPEEETEPEFGGGAGGYAGEPPAPPYYGDEGYDLPDEPFRYEGGGPYLPEWDEAEIKFWDANLEGKAFESADEYERAQIMFYDGYMDDDLSTEDRMAARYDFLQEMDMIDIDWESFREYYDDTH
jgi:hypothetical protein